MCRDVSKSASWLVRGVLLALLVRGLAFGEVRANEPPAPEKDGWKKLFDGKTLDGWKASDFGGEGKVHVKEGAIVIELGELMSGITYQKKDLPKMNYEIAFEAKRLSGDDFFATTTFPVGDAFCSFVVGGWGGTMVGISSIDSQDASQNETSKTMEFKNDRWYAIRIRVSDKRLEAWIDKELMVDFETTDRRLSTRIECRPSYPLGIATWKTAASVKDIKIRKLTEAEIKTLAERKFN